MKFLIVALVIGSSLVAAGCGSAPAANSNTAAANSNMSVGNTRLQNVDPKDLPPGLSANQAAPSGNSVPGISPANANVIPKGTTPTPGIPDPATLGKPAKPGATPTPGIPDPATLKKQMEEMRRQLNSNSNQPQLPPPGAGDGQMMRKQRKIANVNN
jgi:hypothetical protein